LLHGTWIILRAQGRVSGCIIVVRIKQMGHVAQMEDEKCTNFGQRRSSKETVWKT
jgi:hypothetical protein